MKNIQKKLTAFQNLISALKDNDELSIKSWYPIFSKVQESHSGKNASFDIVDMYIDFGRSLSDDAFKLQTHLENICLNLQFLIDEVEK